MSVIGRTFEAAIKKGQENTKAHIEVLQKQNDDIIDNLNEMIVLMKKICDKFEIKADIENENEEV